MDQKSFEAGLMLGLRTAVVCVERAGLSSASIKDQIAEFEGVIDARRTGMREMVAADIFLAMPLMTAADLWGQTHEGGRNGTR